MKAIRFHEYGKPDVLKYVTVADPEVEPGSVVVEIAAASVNHMDSHCRKGMRQPEWFWPHGPSPLPHIPGVDGAGTVVAVGAAVRRLKEGDRVALFAAVGCGECRECCSGHPVLCATVSLVGRDRNGTYAQYVCAPEEAWFRIPDSIDLETAAALPVTYTWAWSVVRKADPRAGDVVLVPVADGGVSSAVIQIAKLHGATVIATGANEWRERCAREAGADAIVDQANVAAEVREFTRGRGVDAVFDHAADDWPQLLASLRSGGTLVTWGATGGTMPVECLDELFYRELRVCGSWTGTSLEFAEVIDQVAAGRLSPLIARKLPLSEAAEASRRDEAGSMFGKTLLFP